MNVVHLPLETWINAGILPCRSSSVCIFTAALWLRTLPGKQGEAEIDGGRIKRVKACVEVHAERVAGIKRSCDADQVLGEVGEDVPVVRLVGVGQCGACDAASEAEMIALRPQGVKAGLDVAQALAVGQLSERHGQKLLPAGQASQSGIAAIPLHTAAKLTVGRKEINCEKMVRPSFMHHRQPRNRKPQTQPRSSNRGKRNDP